MGARPCRCSIVPLPCSKKPPIFPTCHRPRAPCGCPPLGGGLCRRVQDAEEALHLAETAPGLEHVAAEASGSRASAFSASARWRRPSPLWKILCSAMNPGRGGKHRPPADGPGLGLPGHRQTCYGAPASTRKPWRNGSGKTTCTRRPCPEQPGCSVLHARRLRGRSRPWKKGWPAPARVGFRWQEALLLASLGDILSDLDEYESAHQTYTTAIRACTTGQLSIPGQLSFPGAGAPGALAGQIPGSPHHLQQVRR